MTLRRTLSIGTATLFLAAVLTACFPQLPGINTGGNTGGNGGPTVELTGTWTGTDSDGDDWEIEFQSDNTLGISFNGDGPSNEPGDTWRLNGTSLEMTVTGFQDGNITLSGSYDGGHSIPLNGTYAGRGFTLTLTD